MAGKPARRYQFFISSTYLDLIEQRRLVQQEVLKASHFPTGMELFPPEDGSLTDLIKEVIRESDFYVLLVADRYGTIPPDETRSYTEIEFDYAVRCGKPILAVLCDLPKKRGLRPPKHRRQLEAFKEKIKRGCSPAYCTDDTGLVSCVASGINSLLGKHSEKPWGWVRYSDHDREPEQPSEWPLLDKRYEITVSLFHRFTGDPDDLKVIVPWKDIAYRLLHKLMEHSVATNDVPVILFGDEGFAQLDPLEHSGWNVPDTTDILNKLELDGFVDHGRTLYGHWSITKQGRLLYSKLHSEKIASRTVSATS